MINRLERILGVALLLSVSISAHAGTFNDSFDTPRDYLTEGVVNTGWDGFIGRGPGETVSILNASQDRPGELHMASAGGNWPGATLGPFLYKVVAGDFVATVRVASYTTMAYNYCGLMARVANLDDAGSGEDWVSIDYFPQYTVGNIAHSCNDGTRQETVGGANRATPHAYLQLERVGNAFYLRTSTDGVTWVDYPSAMYSPMTRDDMAGLPVQVGIWQATFTGGEGDVAFDDFTLSGAGIIVGNRAYNARPVGSATEVSRDTVLSWTPAEGATAHDVYFGTDEAAVTAADATSPLCVSKAQEPNTYDPDRLEFGQTYYWRIDEIGADGQIIDGGQGAVLSFTVEPFSYPITGIIATASGSNKAAQGPERTVDGSGLNDNDEHSTIAEDGWVSAKGDPQWIQYELPEVCKLDKMLVWNSNQAMESLFGFGAKDVTIEASLDGTEWTTVGTFEFAQAPGESTYAANTTVDLGGATARYVKLTIHSNWGGLFQQYGLSEVRFFSIPVTAREPEPAPGTTGLHPQVALSWRAGREAGSHELYIGADPNAVADGAVAPVTTTLPQYDVAANLGETWYWKVTEVNEAQTPTSWDSPVWSFSTSTYIVVDDFETYTDISPFRVFQTWIDGGGFSPDDFFPNGNNGNGTGALVGYDPQLGHIMETEVVYGGRQSMPMFYDGATSEAVRTFDPPQDWSKYGITTLVLYFYGDAANAGAPLYVKVNGTQVIYDNGASATTTPLWEQWNIDLASFGTALTSVKTLAIGVGNGSAGGSGTIFIDNVRLYAEPPAIATPVDPGTDGLVALYAFENNVQDSSGNNLHGTANGEPGYTDSMAGFGQALAFDGVNDYVDLPVGSLLSSLSSATFTVWVDVLNTGGAWSRVFDFGTGVTVNMWLTPYAPSSTRFAITTNGSDAERRATASRAKSTGWHHIAVVIDAETMMLLVYEDGTLVASNTTTILPKDLGVTTNNWLGRSEYTGDAYFTGSLDDLRIFNRALSEGEIRYLAGDR